MGDALTSATRLPELGPWLGRLCAPPLVDSPGRVPLEDVRLALASASLDLAGAARDFADGDRAAAVSALRAREWRSAWTTAVATAAERVRALLNEAFTRAATESRYPARRLRQQLVSADELAALTQRLAARGAPFEAALVRLEALAAPAAAAGPAGEAAFAEWWTAVTDAARALDASWHALTEAADDEVVRWQGEVARVRAWRRPRWPLWMISALVLAGAGWLGLVLGGYLAVPGWLRPMAEWWWTTVTFG
jgi:hypothetical protein